MLRPWLPQHGHAYTRQTLIFNFNVADLHPQRNLCGLRRCIFSLTGDFQQSVAAEKYHPRAVPWAEDSEDRQSEGVSIERLGLRKVFGSQQRSATENLHAKSPVRYNRGQPWCSKYWKPREGQ